MQYAYRDRKTKKRTFRALWIQRINAAVRPFGLNYSKFIDGLAKAGIMVDRKVMSELAIIEPAAFQAIVEKAKAALPAAKVGAQAAYCAAAPWRQSSPRCRARMPARQNAVSRRVHRALAATAYLRVAALDAGRS